MEAVLAAWDYATVPVDARVRENPLLFASASEIAAQSRVEKRQTTTADASLSTCRPWDHSSFLGRVSSFSIGSWFAKPDVISAFECARHGWRNSARDQLQCKCCNQILCFKIDDNLSEEGALAVAKTFANQLVTGHTDLCPWRDNPSPKAFTTLPIATKRQVHENFVSRFHQEVARMSRDTTLQKHLECDFKVSDAVTAKLYQEVSGGEDAEDILVEKLLMLCSEAKYTNSNSKVLLNAALLIVCGWKFDEENPDGLSDKRMLWCGSCNRRWEMLVASFGNDEAEESGPPAKRTKVEPRVVDLLAQHRYFCPWVAERKSTRAVVEEYGENDAKLWEFMKLPGWKQYAQASVILASTTGKAILNNRSDMDRNPAEALASVRAVLDL
ncbi:Nuclear-interacting partner of ALK [Phytophthora boehmeriae]|uniref:Nuclear-interacting partner of ALK n=1 Tax=Phytophthora boehmeriae TaxID=109152 RepID=A0A8T1W7W3_9STRA|nr:Nuclear-interacting partner of ALK [Phytophthora boehmeriae]